MVRKLGRPLIPVDDFPNIPNDTEKKIVEYLRPHQNSLHLQATMKAMDALVGEAIPELSPLHVPHYKYVIGTSGQTTINLDRDPGNIMNIRLDINGVLQRPNIDFTWLSLTVTLAEPLREGDFVQVVYSQVLPIGTVTIPQVEDLENRLTALEDASGISLPINIGDVNGLGLALDSKQAVGDYAEQVHTHAMADVDGLTSALNGKSAVGHTHNVSDIDGLTTMLTALGKVDSIIAGSNITVDATDPKNPVISATSGGGGGVELPIDIEDVTGLQDSITALSTGSPIVDITTSTATLSMTHVGKFIRCINSAAQTITIPAQETVAWPANTQIEGAQLGAGVVSFVGASGVTLRVNSKMRASTDGQYSAWGLKRIGVNEWLLFGQMGST